MRKHEGGVRGEADVHLQKPTRYHDESDDMVIIKNYWLIIDHDDC